MLMGTFAGGLAMAGMLAARLGRAPQEKTALDLAILGLATFKAARTLASDEVTSFIREPFVEGKPPEPEERPVRGGLKQAVGELVTCSRCVGTWVAAGLAGAEILAPRTGRILTWSLAVGGANDLLQAAFVLLTGTANRVEAS
jgi:hypothetical protein